MSTRFRILSAAAFAALFLPTALEAQDRPAYELPSITVMAISEADPLYESAAALWQEGQWEQAAELYREAAESMPENDPNSYLTFDLAARLYFYAGQYGNARRMMEEAASVAEATGDMVSAAYRHVDAGFIAVWEGYPGKRREHVMTAERFATEYEFEKADLEKIGALTRGVAALPVEDKQ